MKTVLVTGIGGNVAQGILRNIKDYPEPIKVIGCNISLVSAGNHLCDKVELVPYAYDSNYLPTIETIVKKHNIDLIIPATDYEVHYLANSLFNNITLCNSAEITKTFLDKYTTAKFFEKYNISFAESYLPSEYKGNLKDIIVKPREGRGSRGLFFNPENPTSFSDENVVQALHKGTEITTAVYITKDRQLHGIITFIRTLDNGATNSCYVYSKYDDKLTTIINKLITNSDIVGPFNIQSIVENDEVYPFEINCRISGTNSIRSQLGYKDVHYALDEYLFNKTPNKPNVTKGAAIRILMDVIYPDATDLEDIINNNKNHLF